MFPHGAHLQPLQGNDLKSWFILQIIFLKFSISEGEQWLSGRVLDSIPRGRGFEHDRCHCFVFLSKNINPSLVLAQPRKTHPFITERLLMGRKESILTICNIGIRHVFSCINICQFPMKLFEHKAVRPIIHTSPEGPGKCL